MKVEEQKVPIEALLTYEEAANVIKTSVRTLRRYIDDGLLQNVELRGRVRRIRPADLREFIRPVVKVA